MRRVALALVLVGSVASCRSACGKSSEPVVQVAPIEDPGPTLVSPREDRVDASADAAPPFAAHKDDLLSFDATGQKLRVIKDVIRTYDVATKELESERSRPAGEIEAHAGDVILVRSAGEEPDEEEPRHWLVDIPTGKASELPRAWFAEREGKQTTRPSLSARGDRLSVSDYALGRVSSSVYDTNRRELVGKVTLDMAIPIRGPISGELMPDGKAVKWCPWWAPCTVQPLDGGARSTLPQTTVSTLAWTIEIPFSPRDPAVMLPIRVRDGSGKLVGKLDVPVDKGATSVGNVAPYALALCGSDRAIVIYDATLYVLHLPDGKRLLTKEIGGSPPDVVCSATHAAYVIPDEHDAGPITIVDLVSSRP